MVWSQDVTFFRRPEEVFKTSVSAGLMSKYWKFNVLLDDAKKEVFFFFVTKNPVENVTRTLMFVPGVCFEIAFQKTSFSSLV